MVLSAVAFLITLRAHAQDPSAKRTLHVSSALTLVDVTVLNRKIGLRAREPITDLKREDFRIFDNGHEMPIQSFDVGAEHTTRPIALWLIVQCNDDQPPGHHSMFMHGKTGFLKPALTHLAADDQIGVAHWCDNGDAILDLKPSHDPDAALSTVAHILDEKPTTGTQTRNGELAMQRMIRLMLQDTDEKVTHREPIFLFLYGDRCGTHAEEAGSILNDPLRSSAMVYGLNDGTWYAAKGTSQSGPASIYSADPPAVTPMINIGASLGMTYHLVHYYSGETGGEVYSTLDPKRLSDTLDALLTQLHLRFTIGFRPRKLDGKRHHLKVELMSEAQKRFRAAEVRSRREYIPIATS
jgi:hypothetical protein